MLDDDKNVCLQAIFQNVFVCTHAYTLSWKGVIKSPVVKNPVIVQTQLYYIFVCILKSKTQSISPDTYKLSVFIGPRLFLIQEWVIKIVPFAPPI